MLKKKTKYRPVNTNPKKDKKTSSLSEYKFFVHSDGHHKLMDFPTFKREVERYISSAGTLIPGGMHPEVYKYYTQVCNDLFKQGIAILKKYNEAYRERDEVVKGVVTFTITKEGASLVLADLGRTYQFEEQRYTVVLKYSPSEIGEVKEEKTLEYDQALKLWNVIQYTTNLSEKRKQSKNWNKMELKPSTWLPVGEDIHLLDERTPYHNTCLDDHIVESATITALQFGVKNRDAGDAATTEYLEELTIPLGDQKKFTYSVMSKDSTTRQIAIQIQTNTSDLLKEFQKKWAKSENAECETFWKHFEQNIHLMVYAVGTLDVRTGDLKVNSSVIYKEPADEFARHIDLYVKAFQTDASVYVDKPVECATAEEMLETFEAKPLGDNKE